MKPCLWICLRWPETPAGPLAESLQHRLALAMLPYSPRVARFRGDAVVLEIAASLKLFGGVLRLCRRIRQAALRILSTVQLGMAPSATGAWLLAGSPFPRKRVLCKTSLARRLGPLPLHSLPESQAHISWLTSLGCKTLMALRALPRQGLQQRSSPLLLQALDTAYAQAPETFSWFVPPARFRQSLQLEFHLYQAPALWSASQPLLLALCGWLQGQQAALHDFALLVHHEKGRQAHTPTRLSLRFSAATWQQEDFNRVLKEQLQHCVLPQAAIALELIAGPAHHRAPANDSLFPDPSAHTQEERRLLDLLAARLGNHNIRRPHPLPRHLPEEANHWVATPAPALHQPPATVGDRARPFWLLPQPLPLMLHGERPHYQSRPLRLVQGPERIETGWYDGTHHRRDYFVAQDPDGARYWLYRERETGAQWFLHGLFA